MDADVRGSDNQFPPDSQPAAPPMADETPLAPARYRRHRFMLIVACMVVVSALVFRVPSSNRVELAGLEGLPMPSLCMSKSLFDVDCPGCGLTRSVLCFLQGDLARSLHFHRIGWILAAVIVFQFPYRITALVRKQDYPLGKRFSELFSYVLIFLLIANWLVGFFV